MKKCPGLAPALAAALLLTGACSNYNSKIRDAESEFYDGRAKEAASSLREKALEKSNNQLLYLMETGLMLFEAEDYPNAVRVLREAARLGEALKASSLSKTGLTIIYNDRASDYVGEDFERVMVHVYLGLAYMAQKNYDSALVEFRIVNKKLTSFKRMGERRYKENLFARQLAGYCFLLTENYNSAAVEFRKVLVADKDNHLAAQLLVHALYKGRDTAEYNRMKKLYRVEHDKNWQTMPLTAVVFQNGRGPIKIQRSASGIGAAWPKFISRGSTNSYLKAEFYPAAPGAALDVRSIVSKKPIISEASRLQYDLEKTAIRNLDEDYASIVAASTARYIGKRVAGEVVYHELKKKNQFVAVLAWIGSFIYAELSEQADLRCWHTLPRQLQLAVFPLNKGNYHVRLVTDRTGQEEFRQYNHGIDVPLILYRSLN